MYDDILYPTDGSEGAAAALDTCRGIATAYDATVHVLYVMEQGTIHGFAGEIEVTGTGGPGAGEARGESGVLPEHTKSEEVQAEAREYGTALVEEVAEQLGDVETRTEVRHGAPHEAVVDYTDAHGIDLIVMGTRGRTGLERYLLGSVAERVIRTSDVPVLTVRGDDEG